MLVVYIDQTLYKENSNVFDSLFSTFLLRKFVPQNKNSMFISSIHSSIKTNRKTQYEILCDTSYKGWVLQLIGLLEDWYYDVIKCTIIHGSCVVLNDKSILIVGERKAGKTTLTGYLTIKKDATYLDDDCIYILDDTYTGFNMPISVRNNIDDLNEENTVCDSLDGEKINRKLFITSNRITEIPKIDIIIFPNYNENGINSIIQIKNSNLYNKVLNNVRHSRDCKTLFVDIGILVKNSNAYQINYTNSANAYSLIESVL